MNTLDYYEENAAAFAGSTQNVDFSQMQERFLRLLPPGGRILDLGCGAGRDTKAFLAKGMSVDPVDGSREMCRLAADYTGVPVRCMLFAELDETERYDGIWACASILHLPSAELPDVMRKMSRALKKGGIIYTSFKYGEFEGERNGRYFTDRTEDSLAELLAQVPGLVPEEQWVTGDVRPGRGMERWLNVILRKTSEGRQTFG